MNSPANHPAMRDRPLRLLVVCPSWIGDAVMATPAIRLLREAMPGIFIGALVRPGVNDLLDGLDLFDQMHTERPTGILGPKRIGFKLRAMRYDTAILLTNSFSSALITRVAGIPRRVGYDRDGRAMLLTDRIAPPRTEDGSFRIVPAVSYYLGAAVELLERSGLDAGPHAGRAGEYITPPLEAPGEMALRLPPGIRLELAWTDDDAADAASILERAGLARNAPLAILNPGGNNPAKRWPGQRFAALADHLLEKGLSVALTGSPGEMDLLDTISREAAQPIPILPKHGLNLRTLKPIIARASLMVTNDTGPRHIAAAFGVPCVTLFGPTDPRWTTLPVDEHIVLADPTLPVSWSANDHPVRCAIDLITLDRVIEAVDLALDARSRD